MKDDADLVAAARRGEARAFSALVARHQSAARSFALRVCVDAGEADDIAQAAFVFAWMELKRLRDPARFRSWLLGAVWRKAQTRARSAVRRKARDGRWLEGQAETVQPDADAKLTALQLFKHLSIDQRAALALCHGEGWSHAEAADILGVPLGTLKSTMSRAKARLRGLLGDDDEQS